MHEPVSFYESPPAGKSKKLGSWRHNWYTTCLGCQWATSYKTPDDGFVSKEDMDAIASPQH